MKKTQTIFFLSTLCFLIAILGNSCSQDGKPEQVLVFSPEEPLPGETIQVTYSPKEKTFQAADKIQMLAYAYTVGLPTVIPVDMEKKGKTWIGSFTSNEDSYGAAVKFVAGEEFDNNNKAGYFILFYAEDGNPVPGAMAGHAEGLASWGDLLMDTENDPGKALQLFDVEILAHPEMKKKFLYTYVRTLIQTKPEGWEETALAAADEVASVADLDEDTMNTLVNCYRQLRNNEKREDIVNRAIETYPQGYQAQSARYQKFNTEKNLDKKIQLLEMFKGDFPESNMINNMAYSIVREYLSSGKIDELKTYMTDNPDLKESYVYDRIATQLLGKEQELDFAAELIQKGIRLSEQQRDDSEEKPGYLTPEEWEERINKYYLAGMWATYGKILAKKGNPDEALESLEKAVKMSEESQPELNEGYVDILIAQKQ